MKIREQKNFPGSGVGKHGGRGAKKVKYGSVEGATEHSLHR